MYTKISNNIIISEPTVEVSMWVKENLIIDNPTYTQLKRLGKEDSIRLKHVEPKLKVYAKRGNEFVLPFGVLYSIWPLIKNHPYDFKFNNNAQISIISDVSDMNPYDYQEQAINAMINAKSGVLVSSCGSGKTFMGIELIKRLGKKALWLCHTGDLLRQAHDDFKKMYPNVKIGLTTQGQLNIGKDVTISTIQTMDKIDPELYSDQFDVVICDECAHVAGSPTQMKMFTRILSHIPARYKYGLTATPSRSDGTIKTMYAYIGCSPQGNFEPTYIVPRDCVKKIPCIHQGVELNMGYNTFKRHKIYDSAGMLEFNRLINSLSEDVERNKIICDNIEKCYKEGRKQVVLCHRVAHCEYLVEELNKRGIETVLCTGKITDKKRKSILNLETNWSVLVATYSLLKEGISINELDTLHMTTPVADQAITVQCAGRIERFLENKKQPIAFDYVDMDIPYCRKKFTDRKRFLKRR
jgi:superfamily II DNA or RNA helicase